ncbi:MFS transporter [Paenibacillus psychroresistens]|uniref:MFS transporter n=1 Tax=Paenibacillus psychroresistens TaxID=1778678 RepID=A0A6B8RQL7_9BACL|nr:MFS transporter [Paenibacillus psychroresistens]QGQ98137.1 MFS transporter [Paenibacillus psychroresistens]
MKVSQEVRGILLMNASSNIIFNFIGIFVNLYIWEHGRSIFDVTWFNLILFCTWSFSFAFGAKLLTRYSTKLLIRIIAICGAITFLLLTFLQLDNRLLWIAIIAIPIGIMWGFYAIAQNTSLSYLGKGEDFAAYFSLASLIGQAVSILNPIFFAVVIKLIGYSGSFLLMFLFVTLLMIVSFYIPNITISGEKEPLFTKFRIGQVFTYSQIRWILPSCLAAGIFLQFQGLFALLFTFSVSENKLIIALLNVGYACVTICAMLLKRKLQASDSKVLTYGMIFISVGFLITLYPIAPILVFSNLLTTIGMYYFATIWNTRQFSLIVKHTKMEQVRILIWREWFLNIARIAMLLLILTVKDFHGVIFIILMAFALFCALIIPYFSNRSETRVE